ncbi:MAG: hypothetical protein ACKVOS_12460 [Sphingorhabdus sp.]|uniref:hypothetical protein n=1 Tax=Sphingorhabdus sp. TaxID=1902408 RepID=UPI0038FBFE34
MTFIVQKAFSVYFTHMRGHILTIAAILILGATIMMPEMAYARENDQNDQHDTAICTDPKHRHFVIRSSTESLPIRKKEKTRIRRVLM